MEAMLAKQEEEFKDLIKDKEFRDLAGEFEMVDPEMEELHKEMLKQGKTLHLVLSGGRETCQ